MRRCRRLLPQLIRSATPKRKPRIKTLAWLGFINKPHNSVAMVATLLSLLKSHDKLAGFHVVADVTFAGVVHLQAASVLVNGADGTKGT